MGMGQSTPRRLTVRNEEPRIIQVSEDVIRRLSSSARTVEASIEQPPSTTTTATPFTKTYDNVTPLAPSKRTETFYRESKVNKGEVVAAEAEFRRQLSKIEKLTPKKKEDKCKEISAKVAECYSNHPTQTLRCSEQVKEFAKCAYRVPWVSS